MDRRGIFERPDQITKLKIRELPAPKDTIRKEREVNVCRTFHRGYLACPLYDIIARAFMQAMPSRFGTSGVDPRASRALRGRGESALARFALTVPQRARRPGRPLLTPARPDLHNHNRARSSTPRVGLTSLGRAWTAALRCGRSGPVGPPLKPPSPGNSARRRRRQIMSTTTL